MRPPTAPSGGAQAGAFNGPVALWSWFDLPHEDPKGRELSGIAWEPTTRKLWAVQDEAANIVALEPDLDLHTWSFAGIVPLQIKGPLDIEGVVVVPEGFVICSEIGPRVVEVDRLGRYRRDVPFPRKFAEARTNKSFESLSLSPSGRFLYTTSETALPRDGNAATADAGARVRLLRINRVSSESVEHAYTTDPAPHGGDYGVADLAALSEDSVLVLERGWAKGHGNTGRIYRVDLADSSSACQGLERLAPQTKVLDKTLLVDLSTLVAHGLPEPTQPQASKLMDNYEGLCVGPELPDGRRSLVLVSDDNNRSDQFARVLVLAVG